MKFFGVIAAVLWTAAMLAANPRLPAIIGDHMVLQQGRRVPVWGWADPGEAITVRVAGQSHTTTADPGGKWRVMLDPLPPGGPVAMTVEGNTRLTVRDVLAGEVWLCSGQSNMTFPLRRTDTAAEDVPAADAPRIRLFTVPRRSTLEPLTDTAAEWRIATPETARDLSAVAWYFGREVHAALDMPVGLIHDAWAGSVAEEWTDPESLRDPEFQPILDRWQALPENVKDIYRGGAPFDLEFKNLRFAGENGGRALDGPWSFDREAAAGTVLEQSGDVARIAGRLELNDVPQLRARFRTAAAGLNGETRLVFDVRGHGKFRIRFLQAQVTAGGDYASAVLDAGPEWRSIGVTLREHTPQSLSGIAIEVLPVRGEAPRPPAGLFHGMIQPVLPFAIRGAVWYQGEGNSGRAYQYRRLLPALIRGWRAAWGQGDFPFLIAQLPKYGPVRAEPQQSSWAELREAQAMALAVPNTALAINIDQGEPGNVHPPHKREVGHRLALAGLATVYGKELEYSGPLYESSQAEGGAVRIRFRHAAGGLVARGGQLKGFALAGADRKFYWADARIDGDSVVVASAEVPSPVAVRYAWAASPDCNLFNTAGLPAAPFRTDDWPGITANQR